MKRTNDEEGLTIGKVSTSSAWQLVKAASGTKRPIGAQIYQIWEIYPTGSWVLLPLNTTRRVKRELKSDAYTRGSYSLL